MMTASSLWGTPKAMISLTFSAREGSYDARTIPHAVRVSLERSCIGHYES